MIDEKLPRSNYEVVESWFVDCPICNYTNKAKFNDGNPMQPMVHTCADCYQDFVCTYEKE